MHKHRLSSRMRADCGPGFPRITRVARLSPSYGCAAASGSRAALNARSSWSRTRTRGTRPTRAMGPTTAANILLRSVGQQAFCDLRSANPASGFLTIKGTFRFRYKSARISRQRGIVTRPPRASSPHPWDHGPSHCFDRSRIQCHPSRQPRGPEVDAQGLFSRFLSSTVRSR